MRHETDLYGTKLGVGKFNPIMVENLHRFPDDAEFMHPDMTKKSDKEKPAPKRIGLKPATPVKAANDKNAKTPKKFVLTNSNK